MFWSVINWQKEFVQRIYKEFLKLRALKQCLEVLSFNERNLHSTQIRICVNDRNLISIYQELNDKDIRRNVFKNVFYSFEYPIYIPYI